MGESASTASATMHIGEVAERTSLSLRTIRHYDEVGLLPASSRTEGGFRVYTEADVERLLVIRRMKPLGFSLEEMADLLSIVDGLESASGAEAAGLRERLAAYVESAAAKRRKLEENLRGADEFIATLSRF
ncbi:MerR family transcriptional regulator [Arthrobacter sp. JZ12]|uniref:MerR family transcriptional regulator n=1 Tax=Arthrobacter sp. JZ12 TaxID=2654190 RepID=UPI002B45C6EB|nr:MerR family transcriptional regulator [Arthrobacter sp. JZ12]WRH24405.1 MerR family transcriptional regulator [Arthrobacter sp. JZ12]